jgi:hypothetical protein
MMTHLSVKPAGAIDPAATSPAKKSAPVGTQSFAEELSLTFAAARSKFGISANNRESPVVGTPSQNPSSKNVERQISVASSSLSGAAPIGLNALVPKTSAAVAPPPPTPPTATDALISADDSYWAAQPPAVQQLRNIDDPDQRAALGAQLASQGYSIDTPVMIWGWDPSLTTQLRQSFGYTWVPSAMQNPVAAAPGITGGGFTPYNPADPPPGSISV